MQGSILVVFLLTGMSFVKADEKTSPKSAFLPTILEYFPELQGDLTRVSWAHAVNSNALLEQALSDRTIMMLEADVVLGTLIKKKNQTIPIMAHPPKNTSDLSLEMFLTEVIRRKQLRKKGIKLDFKSAEAFEASVTIMDGVKDQVTFPMLLNADIVPGPINSPVKPVDQNIFLNLSIARFPKTTLSLGWTTLYGPNMSGMYTDQHFLDMGNAIANHDIMQPITVCLRAGMAPNNKGIMDLVEAIDRFQDTNRTSVTIWMSSDSDPVDVPKLKKLILFLGKSKVILDVPKFIRDELGMPTNSAVTPINAAGGALVALLKSVSTIFSKMF